MTQLLAIAHPRMAPAVRNGGGMTAVCTFSGSYYDQTPWTEQACAADSIVPAGCPVHFVTAAPIMPSDVTAEKIANDGSSTPTASTATLVDVDRRGFVLPDEFSCDCAPTSVSIDFQRFAVALPGGQPGDAIALRFPGQGQSVGFEIGAAGPCPPADWPTEYDVALACDRCPMDPGNNGSGTGEAPGLAGCAAGADPYALVLTTLIVVPVARRRRRAAR